MATTPNKLPEKAPSGGVTNVLQMIQGLTGTKNTTTTTGGSTSEQTMLSPDAMTALIQQMLESNQGLAQVSSGQRSAGLYNSSVNTQLVNDLLTRVSGQAAVAAAPRVTTRQPTTVTNKTPGLLGDMNPVLAAIAMPLLKSGAAKAGDLLKSTIKGGNPSGTAGGVTRNRNISDIFGGDSAGILGGLPSTAGVITDFAGSLGSLGGAESSPSYSLGNVSNFFSTDFGATAQDFAMDAFSSGTSFMPDNLFSSTSGSSGGFQNLFDSGDSFGENVGENVLQAGTSYALSLIPGVGPVLAGINAIFGGDLFEDASVICTLMHKAGYLPTYLHTVESLYGASVNPRIYRGYRVWADPTVRYLQKSPRATKFLAPLVRAFAQETAHQLGFESRGSFVGKILKGIGEPVCYLIGYMTEETSHVCAG